MESWRSLAPFLSSSPCAHIAEGEPLGAALADQWPSYAAYMVSFLTIGIMWVNHHHIVYAHRADHPHLPHAERDRPDDHRRHPVAHRPHRRVDPRPRPPTGGHARVRGDHGGHRGHVQRGVAVRGGPRPPPSRRRSRGDAPGQPGLPRRADRVHGDHPHRLGQRVVSVALFPLLVLYWLLPASGPRPGLIRASDESAL
jgi:hypothetical protein